MNTAIIGVGSNVEPETNIKAAKNLLIREHVFLGESSFVKTRPMGYTKQDDFANGAFLTATDLDLDKFKSYLRMLESRLGRVRTDNPDGPRTIDLDIVVWNGEIIDFNFYRWDFLRNAVLELAPDLLHTNSTQLKSKHNKRLISSGNEHEYEVLWRA